MWPFEARVRRSLAGLSHLARVDVTATIASADAVSSPFSDLSAALVWVQVTESARPLGNRQDIVTLVASGADLSPFEQDRVLGSVVLGDTLIVRTDEAIDVTLCPRTARIVFARHNPQRAESSGPVSTAPAGLEALLDKASGGTLVYRDIGLRQGTRVRLRAFVEPTSYVSPTPYRSAAKRSFAVREDAGPVEIVELVTAG